MEAPTELEPDIRHEPSGIRKHPFASWIPLPNVDEAVVEVMLRALAENPPANVEVAVVVAV